MWMLLILAAIISQLPENHAQTNQCTAAAIATCGQYTCVQTNDVFSCLCADLTLKPSAAACGGGVATTQPPVVIPNQCANAVCPAGATCVPTNQNPALYICVCPNHYIANPDCSAITNPTNPCTISNPCLNGGTCVINSLTNQAVCICPSGSYGARCTNGCSRSCNKDWCYNGARCANAYGEAFCYCGEGYRGRRCELRHNRNNYVYLHHNPHH